MSADKAAVKSEAVRGLVDSGFYASDIRQDAGIRDDLSENGKRADIVADAVLVYAMMRQPGCDFFRFLAREPPISPRPMNPNVEKCMVLSFLYFHNFKR